MPPRLAVVGALCLTVSIFFLWRLDGNIAAFLYRPGASVSDLTVTFWPNVHYIRETWRTHGQIPLWRTLIFCGSPFDADPQSGLWYPPNLVFAFLPTAVGFNVLFAAHAVLAGLGTWTWSRATGTSGRGASVAALAYAFTPNLFAHLGFGHVGFVYAAAWVPWALRAAYHVGRGSRTGAGLLGLALGLQAICHPQLALYTGLVTGVYGLAVAWTTDHVKQPTKGERFAPQALDWSSWASRLLRLLLAAGLALAVAAVQLLPLLRLSPLTARASMDLSETAVSSLPPRYLWGLVLADHRGYADYVLYAGVPTLLLALLALRRRQARFWWILMCIALTYALGDHTPLHRWAFRLLPPLAWVRGPSRIWLVCSAPMALMAGWGIDNLLGGIPAQRRRWTNRVAMALGSLAPALLIGYAVFVERPPNNLIAFGLVTPVTCALIVLAAAGRLPRRTSTVALIAVLLADLWVVDATLIEGRAVEAAFAETGLGAYLARRREDRPFRVYSPSYSLPRHVAARYNLETADGVDPLYLQAYSRWMQAASGVQRYGYSVTVPPLDRGDDIATANKEAVPDARLLGLLNVRYVAAEFPVVTEGLREVGRFGQTYLYENEWAQPRAFVVGQVEPVEDLSEAIAWLQSHDVEKAVAVENGHPLASGNIQVKTRWVRRSPNRLVLDISVNRQGFLLLSQAWYPSWRAEVDGDPVRLWKADGVLSGVYLQPGRHTVSLAYRPRWTLTGGIMSLTVTAAIAVAGWTRKGDKGRTCTA